MRQKLAVRAPLTVTALATLLVASACTDSTSPTRARPDFATRDQRAAGHPTGTLDTSVTLTTDPSNAPLYVSTNAASKAYVSTQFDAFAFQSPNPKIQQEIQYFGVGGLSTIDNTTFSADGSKLYLLAEQDTIVGTNFITTGQIAAFDTGATKRSQLLRLPNVSPSAAAVTPNGRRLYALGFNTTTIYVVSEPGLTLVDSIPLAAGQMYNSVFDIVLAPNSDELAYVLAFNSNANNQAWVLTVDLHSKQTIHTTALPSGSWFGASHFMATSSDGTRLYVLDSENDRLFEIAEPAGTVLATLQLPIVPPVGGGPTNEGRALARTPDDAQLWVTTDTTIQIINRSTFKVSKVLYSCGANCKMLPQEVAFANNGKYAIVAQAAGSATFYK